jgi:hypothetical protein
MSLNKGSRAAAPIRGGALLPRRKGYRDAAPICPKVTGAFTRLRGSMIGGFFHRSRDLVDHGV